MPQACAAAGGLVHMQASHLDEEGLQNVCTENARTHSRCAQQQAEIWSWWHRTWMKRACWCSCWRSTWICARSEVFSPDLSSFTRTCDRAQPVNCSTRRACRSPRAGLGETGGRM